MPQPNTAPGSGMVRIRKKGRFWYARFRDAGRRHEVPLRVTNRVPAETKARQINDALEAGQPWEWVLGRSPVGERTFAQVIDEYLEKGSVWADTTRRQNAGTVNMLLQEFGDLPVSKLDRATIEGYLARRRDEGLARSSSNRYLCVLKVALAKAVEWGYLRQNPAAQLRCAPENKKLPRPYHDDELERLLPLLRPSSRDIATVYLETGMRKGELIDLKWADVDMGANTLTVRQPKNRRDRVVPMSPNVREILLTRRRDSAASPVVDMEPRVYGFAADIRQVLRRAYVPAHITPERRHVLRPIHSLRDTNITRLVAAGIPLDRVQLLAGHNSVEMTRRYAQTSDASLHEAVAKVFG